MTNPKEDINWALGCMVEAMQEVGFQENTIYQVRNRAEPKLIDYPKEKGAQIYEEWS
jgi:hypothetical protein